MKLGSGALWLPLGFTAGYLALLLFVAAPLRRFGAYTISDFAEARLGSPRIRVLAAVVVLLIAGFYLVPQLKGAGLTLGEVTGGAVLGRRRRRRHGGAQRRLRRHARHHLWQAFQYWMKTFAIARRRACCSSTSAVCPNGPPCSAASCRAPATGLVVQLAEPQQVTFPEATSYSVDGVPTRAAEDERHSPRARSSCRPTPSCRSLTGSRRRRARTGRGPSRLRPTSPVFVYSLLLATFLGTMGLPHILVRF